MEPFSHPINLPATSQPRVIIIGGGFAGITLAQALRKAPVQVVMFDKQNYHTFQPLLYQVATGGLEPDSIAFPLRKAFAGQKNFFFRMAGVERIDPVAKVVYTNIGEAAYDHLVVATGASTNFFGIKALEDSAMGMKSVPEALNLRSAILQAFEQANHEQDPEVRAALLKFVVVGGGPTGVETAGALAEIKTHVLPSDYPELDNSLMEIHLIESGGELLGPMAPTSREGALKALQDMGVNVMLNTVVKDYDGYNLTTTVGEIEAATVIWAAGVKGNPVAGIDQSQILERPNRVKVNVFNEVEGHDSLYAIGDVAAMVTDEFPRAHPQVAPVAMQQARALAENLQNKLKGAPMKPFAYFDKGSMATIGRNKAVLDGGDGVRWMHMRGFMAWMGWMFVHILYIIGFRNKAVIFINWVWSYFTYDKGTRLIIRPFKRIEIRQHVMAERER